MEPTSHQAYIKTVRDLADSNWGLPNVTTEKAQKDLLGDVDLAGAGLLEIVRRMNVVITALCRDTKEFERAGDEVKERPDYAAKIPGARPGMIIYSCTDLQDGVNTEVIVYVDSEGYSRSVILGKPERDKIYAGWNSVDDKRTIKEVLKAEAEKDVTYHKPRLEYAQRVLKAIEAGENLDAFVDGKSEEEES